MSRNESEYVKPAVPHVFRVVSNFSNIVSTYEGKTNRYAISLMNPTVSTTETRIIDFTWMTSLKFTGSKVDEDIQEFIDEVHNIVGIIGFPTVEKVELSTY